MISSSTYGLHVSPKTWVLSPSMGVYQHGEHASPLKENISSLLIMLVLPDAC